MPPLAVTSPHEKGRVGCSSYILIYSYSELSTTVIVTVPAVSKLGYIFGGSIMNIIMNIKNKSLYSFVVSIFEFIGSHTNFEFGLCGGAINMVALYGRKGKIEFTLI